MEPLTTDQVRQIIREEIASFVASDRFLFQKHLQIFDGRHIQVGKTTGTKIGTETTQKIGFYNKTPVVQAGAISSPNSPGATYSQADATSAKTAIDAIRTALTNLGLTG